MTLYNKKAKVSGRQVYTVSDVKTSGDVTTASIKTEMFDEKDNTLATGNNNIMCKGGVMMMSMKMMMPQQQQQQAINTADVTTESNFLDYPSSMNVGDDLKEGNFLMDMDMNGMKQQMAMIFNNRKVEAKEKITTTAGSWDCFKISYKGKMTVKTLGIGIPINMTGTEWFAPGFGIVKTQTNYGSTEITSIK